jgi:hypothetical protein
VIGISQLWAKSTWEGYIKRRWVLLHRVGCAVGVVRREEVSRARAFRAPLVWEVGTSNLLQ